MKLKPIPQEGIVGETAFREAKANEMRDIISMVEQALREKLKQQMRSECWFDSEAIYADRIIVRVVGKHMSYPYTVSDDNVVTIGEPSEVIREFTPVSASMRESVSLIEAVADKSGKPNSFLIRVIRSGLSNNKVLYPPAVLREAAPLFNGARVFAKSDKEHLAEEGKDVGNLIGGLRDAKFVEGADKSSGEIQAVLDVFEAEAVVAGKLREAVERGMSHLFGFSIDVSGTWKKKNGFKEANSFNKVHSVDLIVDPGAGGELIHLIEAVASSSKTNEDDAMLLKRMIVAIKRANKGNMPQGLDESDEEAVFAAFQEATAASNRTDTSGLVTKAELEQMEVRGSMREAVRTSKLPEKAQQKLIKQLETDPALTTAKFVEAINEEREYLATFTESGHIRGLGGGDGTIGPKGIAEMLDKLLDPEDREFVSLKECYQEATGDKHVTGLFRHMRFREATIESDSFPIMLGNALNRRVVEMFNADSRYKSWRDLVSDIVPASDFRERKTIMYGGFGDLPIVGEDAAYVDLAKPTEIAEAYSPGKRGGLVPISRETIKNDDVGFVMKIPRAITVAAHRTLYKFVLDIIRTNPVMADTKALFHVDHGNLLTTALTKANYLIGRLAMMKQADHDTGEPMGLTPKFLLIPADLEEAAFEMFRRDTNVDADFAQSTAPIIRPIPYWTDANDWAMVCDPAEHPTIEICFIDNRQEPELLIQDMGTAGSMFTHDRLTWKIRHEYGGVAASHKGMRKNVVA